MIGKKQAQRLAFKPGDYDQPTEPVGHLVLPPPVLEPTAPLEGWHPAMPGVPNYPYAQPPAYPILPQPPQKYRGYPPGGSPGGYDERRSGKHRSSLVPGLVKVGLALVQLVLLARVVCLLLGMTANTIWLALLFFVSDRFVAPLRWLATMVDVGPLAGTSLLLCLELLLAFLAYRVLSRLLVGLLKAIFQNQE